MAFLRKKNQIATHLGPFLLLLLLLLIPHKLRISNEQNTFLAIYLAFSTCQALLPQYSCPLMTNEIYIFIFQCGYTFCFDCKESWHMGMTCEEYRATISDLASGVR